MLYHTTFTKKWGTVWINRDKERHLSEGLTYNISSTPQLNMKRWFVIWCMDQYQRLQRAQVETGPTMPWGGLNDQMKNMLVDWNQFLIIYTESMASTLEWLKHWFTGFKRTLYLDGWSVGGKYILNSKRLGWTAATVKITNF